MVIVLTSFIIGFPFFSLLESFLLNISSIGFSCLSDLKLNIKEAFTDNQ